MSARNEYIIYLYKRYRLLPLEGNWYKYNELFRKCHMLTPASRREWVQITGCYNMLHFTILSAEKFTLKYLTSTEKITPY